MPGDGSCLYSARRACFAPAGSPPNLGEMVEAPGTAPGSATPIPQAVYRHSRLPDALDIGCDRPERNPGERARDLDNLRVAATAGPSDELTPISTYPQAVL